MPEGTSPSSIQSAASLSSTGLDGSSDAADPDPSSSVERESDIVQITVAPGLAHAVNAAWLGDRLKAAVMTRPERFGSVHVFIIGDELMRDLHQAHLNDPTTTDVLTFDLTERSSGTPAEDIAIEVEIVVCADEAARRSAEIGHDLNRELLLYAVHGLLHCGDFDDRTESGAAAMHEEEDRVLRAIGVGAIYRPEGADGPADGSRRRGRGARK
ncbi:MAG: rRNA maturation RNase YbeY [Phycisphaeraceae bacterium]|nr:rRNA maturation RNase YbeY [Phycisphaerales bacterium]QOJ17815.1 MAG: rRNA maturation RNase YbeY [Phycisphaeraceae bacterium]